MPGYNQTQLNYSVQNANGVIVMLGDSNVAFAQTSAQAVDFGTEALYGIGSAKPQEIQQLRFLPSVTIDSFVLTAQGYQVLGYSAILSSLLANNQFDLHIIDQKGNLLFTFVGAVAQNYNMNIPVNAVVTQAIGFLAMDVLDGTGQSILNSNSAMQNISSLLAIGAGLNTAGL